MSDWEPSAEEEPSMTGGFYVRPDSLNNNANLLVELAGALGAGRPDHELSRKACAPAAPEELGEKVKAFADFAGDQYQDVVALLSALSTKLDDTANTYGTADQAATQRFDQFLAGSRYVPPSER
jgi:hypothetical protein